MARGSSPEIPGWGVCAIFLVYCIASLLLYICVVSCPHVIFPTFMAQYSLFVLKMPLNPSKQTISVQKVGHGVTSLHISGLLPNQRWKAFIIIHAWSIVWCHAESNFAFWVGVDLHLHRVHLTSGSVYLHLVFRGINEISLLRIWSVLFTTDRNSCWEWILL